MSKKPNFTAEQVEEFISLATAAHTYFADMGQASFLAQYEMDEISTHLRASIQPTVLDLVREHGLPDGAKSATQSKTGYLVFHPDIYAIDREPDQSIFDMEAVGAPYPLASDWKTAIITKGMIDGKE